MPRSRAASDPFGVLDTLAERLGPAFERLGSAERLGPAFERLGPAAPAGPGGWSGGEITNTWVVSTRTARPERGGLRCAKTFGPFVDDACLCTKYQGATYRGVRCERCGVEVGPASLRSERFGHIVLAAPVPHPWFREYAAAALALDPDAFDQIVGGEAGLVTAVRDGLTPVAPGDLVSATRLAEIDDELGAGAVSVLTGPDAVAERAAESGPGLRPGVSLGAGRGGADELAARGLTPRSLFLDVLPVLPPGLRERRHAYEYAPRGLEALFAEAGRDLDREREPELVERARRLAQPAGLDALYAEIVQRNARLADVRARGYVPALVVYAEWRALRDAVTALMGPCELGPPRRGGHRLVDLLNACLESIDSGGEPARGGALERLLFALGLGAPGEGASGRR